MNAPRTTSQKIIHLSRHQIDDQAWDNCITRAPNGLPYAKTWLLDATTGKRWNGLVSPDYQFVCPLPFNRKLAGIPQIYRPRLTQQLGVFGPITPAITQQFLSAIPAHYWRVVLPLNAACQWPTGKLTTRTNLILSLERPYEIVKSGYHKSLRKRLRRASEALTFQPTTDIPGIVQLYQNQVGNRLDWKSTAYQSVTHTLELGVARGEIHAFAVQTKEGALAAAGCFLEGNGRIINLFGASTDLGRAQFGMHFLLDRVIAQFAERAALFDFEGSELPGVASFFRSFGAQEEIYFQYQRRWW